MNEKNIGIFPAKIAHVEDKFTVVINRGSKSGICNGDLFLVYRQGKEILDPETKQSLGYLEIILGKGKVTHVQEQMATLKSAEYYIVSRPEKTVTEEEKEVPSFLFAKGKTKKITYTEPEKAQQPFKGVQVGDLVKPI